MAIAYDSSAQGVTSSGNTLTFSHTCSGSNRILFVFADSVDGSKTISGVTYAGVSMTSIYNVGYNSNARQIGLFYLIAPSTGANNVVITISGNTAFQIEGCSASYTGAKQSGQPDANTDSLATGNVATRTVSVTTVANNCWLVGGAINVANTSAANTTIRQYNNNDDADAIFDTNAAQTPAGNSYSLAVNAIGGSNNVPMLMCSFAPALPVNGNFFMYM